MNILVIASWYKDSENPIAGSFIEEQARMLQRRGHTITVLHAFINGTFKDTLSGKKELCSEENDCGIRTIRLSSNVYFPKIRALSYRRLCKKALQIVQDYISRYGKFDIIHSHAMFMAGVIANYVNKKTGIPYFHTEHTSGLVFNPKQYNSVDWRLAKKVYEQSEQSFFVSEFAKNKILATCGFRAQNVSVLHNVVNPMFFEAEECEKFRSFTFLTIGNFIPLKNFDKVIAAWAEYVVKHSDDKLIIVGDGPLKNDLGNAVKRLRLTDSVEIRPRQSRIETAHLMKQSHVVVSASSIETFGMTLAESLASGIPVITTDSGGVRDIVTPSTGILVNKVSSIDIANAMCAIRENYASFDSGALRKYAESKFSEDVIYKQLTKCYL